MLSIKSHFITIPLHPSFWCALALILGITISSLEPSYRLPLYFTLIALSLVILLITLTRSLRSFITLLIIIGFFLGGFYRYANHVYHYQKNQASLLNRPLSGIGTIEQCTTSSKHFKTCLTLTITKLHQRRLYAPATVRLYIKKKLSLKPDDVISFKDLLIKKQKNKRFGWYLCKENLIGCGYIQKLFYKRITRPKWSLKRYCAAKRASIATSVAHTLSKRAYTLFATLFLGKKEPTYCYYELRRSCTHWGIVHYLARSGLHVVVLIGIWLLLLRLLGFAFVTNQLLIILLLGSYYFLSWPSISFVRAVLVFLLYQLCILLGRPYAMLHLLALTTIIILIVNPLQLFSIGFQLSFGLTCTLGLYREITHQIRIIQPEST